MRDGAALTYQFADYELDTVLFELRAAGRPVPVEPQVFNVMRYLVEHRDVVVTKEELLDSIWGDRFVSESALTSRIKAARKAIGDDGQAQRLIRTLHGRGYRFVAPVSEVARPVAAADERVSGIVVDDRAAGDDEVALVERDEVRDQIRALVDRAVRARRGAVVLVSGEAGIGKTAVVDAVRRDASDRAVVLVGGCDDLATPRTMGPFHDIAFDAGGELAEAFHTGDRDRVIAALLAVLADRPTVVVVEDLHWADDATIDAIRVLARRLSNLPVVMLVTFRAEPAHRSDRVLAALGALTGHHVHRIELQPLTIEGLGRLAGGRGDVADLFAVTHGNPFFVSEVLRSPGVSVPATVRDSVLARLVRLPPPAQALLTRLSVIPSRAERWLADRLAPDAAESLAAAQRHGLLAGDATYVWFRHELARRAVESAMTREELIRASEVVLASLVEHAEADGIEPSRIVHHARQANDVDTLLRYGPAAAAEAARLGSHGQAVEHYRAVLEHRSRLSATETASCLTGLGYSLYLLDRFQAAAETANEAVLAAEQSRDTLLIADALSVLSRAALWAHGPTSARGAAIRQVEVLEGEPDEARLAEALCDLARTCSNLSTLGPVADPSAEALTAADRALALGQRLGRSEISSQALTYRGSSRVALGDAGGFADLERALDDARDHRPEVFVRCCVNAAGSAFRVGKAAEAERYIALGLSMSMEGEFHAGAYRLALTREAMRFAHGDWRAAEEGLHELIDRADDPGIMRALARTLLARVMARRGDAREAAEVLRPAIDAATTSTEIQLVAPVATAQVELMWLADGAVQPPALATAALALNTDAGGAASRAELCRYLQRLGAAVEHVDGAPGPWAHALAGHSRDAAAAWQALGERYEQALELASCGDRRAHCAGLEILAQLGATATLDRVS